MWRKHNSENRHADAVSALKGVDRAIHHNGNSRRISPVDLALVIAAFGVVF